MKYCQPPLFMASLPQQPAAVPANQSKPSKVNVMLLSLVSKCSNYHFCHASALGLLYSVITFHALIPMSCWLTKTPWYGALLRWEGRLLKTSIFYEYRNHNNCMCKYVKGWLLNRKFRLTTPHIVLNFLLYLAKLTTNINHSVPVEKWNLELNPWIFILNFDLDLKTGWKKTKCHVKTWFITVWHWPLTWDLDHQSQAT